MVPSMLLSGALFGALAVVARRTGARGFIPFDNDLQAGAVAFALGAALPPLTQALVEVPSLGDAAALGSFLPPLRTSWRAFVKVAGASGVGAPQDIYRGPSQSRAMGAAHQAAAALLPHGSEIAVVGPCPSSWIGHASCYRCAQKLTGLGWRKVAPSIPACTTSSYLGAV